MIHMRMVCLLSALLATSTASAMDVPASVEEVRVAPSLDDLKQELLTFNIQRRKDQITGMSVLLGWSVANMGVGAVGWSQADSPEWVAFHQGNIGWNAVNMALAVPGLLSGINDDPRKHSLGEGLQKSHASQIAFGFNTGLDVGWAMMGLWVLERGMHRDDPRLLGLGRSMILQGSALFLFDLVMWMKVASRHRRFVATQVVGERLGVQVSTTF